MAKKIAKPTKPTVAASAGEGGETHQSVSSSDRSLTTNQGVPIADNQNSLKSGRARADAAGRFHPPREDHPLRSRAHSRAHRARPRLRRAWLFSSRTNRWRELTKAAFLQDAGKQDRRSSCASRPWPAAQARSTLPRDVRGFAVKFYTQEGNFDLVGNNIPVFFIQDAIKFPDLDPCGEDGAATAASRRRPRAHDTFWDFISLMPESHAHDHVGHVGPRDSALAADDGRLRRPHLPAGQCKGRVHVREVSLAAELGAAFDDVG